MEVISDAFGDERNDGKLKEPAGMVANSKTGGPMRAAVGLDMEDIANDKADAAASSDDVLTSIKDSILALIGKCMSI